VNLTPGVYVTQPGVIFYLFIYFPRFTYFGTTPQLQITEALRTMAGPHFTLSSETPNVVSAEKNSFV